MTSHLVERLVGYGIGHAEAEEIITAAFELGALSVAQKPKRGTRFNGPIKVPHDWSEWAKDTLIITQEQINTQYASFSDYWQAKAGKDAVKLDWQKTWQVWLRKNFKERSGGTLFNSRGADPLAPADRVRVHPDSDQYRAVARKRGLAPFTGRDGFAWISVKELESL